MKRNIQPLTKHIQYKTVLRSTLSIVLAISILAAPVSVRAISPEQIELFRRGVLDYNIDRCATVATGKTYSVELDGAGRVEQAFNFLRQNLGLTAEQAAVIVGNMMHESSPDLDPTTENNIGAFGIAQWLNNRRDNLNTFAKQQGTQPSDFLTQLQFLQKELTGPYKATLDHLKTLKSAAGINQAVYDYEATYEISGHSGIPRRQAFANAVYKKYANTTPGAPSAAAPATPDTPAATAGADDECGTGAGTGDNGGSPLVNSTTCNVTAPVMGEGSANRRQMSQADLTKVYGAPGTAASHPDIVSKLVTVDFNGHKVKVHQLVAGCLNAVANEIKTNKIAYKVKEMGCYRYDGNGAGQIGTRSYHTYGVACDINWSTNPYSGGPAAHDMPDAYVQAFHNHGWSWGGNWNSVKDYMHFEFNGINP